MKIALTHIDLTKANGQTLVVFATEAKAVATTKKVKAEPSVGLKHISPEMKSLFASSLVEKTLTGKAGEALTFREAKINGYKNIVVIGLGKESEITAEACRAAAGCIESTISASKFSEVTIHADSIPSRHLDTMIQGLTEGLLLSAYRFENCKSKKDETKDVQVNINTLSKTKIVTEKFQQGVILAEATNFSKFLGDMPGNLMTPSILADEAVKASKGTGIKATIWDKARIKKEKMGGLLGVANGSDEDPRFIILEYKGAAQSKKPVVFVGKGLTFDTGGISIKPGGGMEEMKYDMCGGANVIGALIAIAKLKLKVNAIAVVPATENMPSGKATKPGDIHTARNGKTFEVNNTDAEGRLILSDALCYASELKPAAIIDAATLTGAMVVALGNTHTGFFTRNEELTKKINAAADISGEWVWRMPLCDHHVKDMKGTYADLSNISSGKGAGSATAAAFLEQFVEKEIPWAHFDIAGTAWSVGNRLNYAPKKGASGCMVRTFVEIAKLYK